MSYFLAFAGFCALIVLHELGHFAAAKWVGMRVERFSLFFGKPLWKIRRGETEYGVGWLPAGGYVKISGMNPHEDLPPEVVPRAYFNQPVWKRLVVIIAGPLVNLVVAFLILFVFFWSNGENVSNGLVERIEPGKPAAAVLQPGDRIISVDGKEGDLTVLTGQIARHRCEGRQTDGCEARSPAVFEIERDGRTQTVEITPVYDKEALRTRVGFGYGTEHRDLGPGGGADKALYTMWDVTSTTVSTIGRLFVSSEARDEVSGVVGSYETTRRSFDVDMERAVLILALISLSLAVVNLFPFLPLDGGHIFWAIAEKVRGKAIPFSVMERASVIGIVLVVLLFVIGLENDIGRLSNGEFEVR